VCETIAWWTITSSERNKIVQAARIAISTKISIGYVESDSGRYLDDLTVASHNFAAHPSLRYCRKVSSRCDLKKYFKTFEKTSRIKEKLSSEK